MTQGHARTSGKPGVPDLYTGPGVVAVLPLSHNARAGEIALVTAGAGKRLNKLYTDIRHPENLPGRSSKHL